MSSVNVIGLGYIGLPTAALAANKGHKVTGIDINQLVVDTVNAGDIHIEEPGLKELVQATTSAGSLSATTELREADIHLIIVPTPFIEANKAPDMKYVRKAAQNLAGYLKEGDLVVLESTSPVGATRNDVQGVINETRPELEGKVHYAFCPERAIPGKTLQELIENDRVVGGLTPKAAEVAKSFYSTFVQGDILLTDAETAELVKLTENASRDVQIAFANELSLVCDTVGANVWEVIKLANHHPRVNILQPGPGVGGHCIAVDPWFIVSSAPKVTPLMRTAREVNDGKPSWVMEKVSEAMAANPNATVSLLGVAFKPDVDDMRESPALAIAKELSDANGAKVVVCDPHVADVEGLNMVDIDKALQNDIVVMLTDHQEFKDIPRERLSGKTLIDTRGTFTSK